MALRAPLRGVTRAVRVAAGAGGRIVRPCLLDVGHRLGNVALRLSVALLCVGLALQAVSNSADPYRCGALVKHGAWPPYTRPEVDAAWAYEQLGTLQQEGHELPPARPFDRWEPAGCRMHEYSRDDIRECLGGRRLLFVGDSTARVLFFAALTRLEHEAAEALLRTIFVEENPSYDLSVDSESVQLDFMWDPLLNSSAFKAEISRMQPHADAGTSSAGLPPKPDLVVVGSAGLWAARNTGDKFFETFQAATDRAALAMGDAVRPFTETGTAATNYVFLTPVTIPRYEMLPVQRAEALLPERIELMNSYYASLPRAVQSHVLTAYNEMTLHVPEAYESTGLHVTASVAERWIDIPLNARCNGLLSRPAADRARAPSLTYKTTCCVAYPGPVRGQTALWYGLCCALAAPVLVLLFRGRPLASTYRSCSFLAVAVLYCYVADRTHALPKAEKHYNESWLRFALIASGVCFAASRRHVPPRKAPASKALEAASAHQEPSLEVEFLPRHLSDEWKGLMQAAFLLLAYQDGSEMLIVRKWTEVFINAYLFLSAFGHSSYFLRTGDFSFRRVASVLFRLNALPCLLALMLDGRESGTQNSVSRLYSFPRLVSFWFLATYATLRLGSRSSGGRPDLLLARICMSATVFSYVLWSPGKYGLFEMASRAGLYFCGATWDVEDMRLAVCLAWCAPFWGMAIAVIARRAAFVCQRTQQPVLDRRRGTALSANRRTPTATVSPSWLDQLLVKVLYPNEFTEPLQPMLVILCFVFLFAFADVTVVSPLVEGVPYPFITSTAVVCFAVLRNFHRDLRANYLHWPATLGAFALELFVLHNHIWLSGNGTGHLRLFSVHTRPLEGYTAIGSLANAGVVAAQCLEVAGTSAVFVWACWRSHWATRMLSAALFGGAKESDGTTTAADVAAGLVADAAADEGQLRLPLYGGGDGFPAAPNDVDGRGRSWASDARLRGACVLLLFWGVNKLYV